jgi:hypothetical protein
MSAALSFGGLTRGEGIEVGANSGYRGAACSQKAAIHKRGDNVYCSVTDANGKIMPCTGSLSAENFEAQN